MPATLVVALGLALTAILVARASCRPWSAHGSYMSPREETRQEKAMQYCRKMAGSQALVR